MRIRWPTSLIGIALLISCGRTEPAVIKNNTGDTLQLTIKLNYPASTDCPDNYFQKELYQKHLHPQLNNDSTNYWLTQYGTLTNIATLILLPNKRITLGTIRTGLHRTNYKVWEFTRLTAIGKNFKIDVRDSGLLRFIKQNKHLIGQDDYEFNIGENK